MKKPTKDLFVPLEKDPFLEEKISQKSVSYWQDAWHRLKQNKIAMISLWILLLFTLISIAGPSLSSYTYYETFLEKKNLLPCREFWFGSDDLGRDIFTRICYGARISLSVGCIAAFIDLIIGVLWGGIAALVGKRTDEIMMRIADILYAIPNLLIIILLMLIMGSGIIPIIISLTITGWINMSRIVRGQILQLKRKEYVLASIALGASFYRILFKHLIPNIMGSIIVTVTLTIPSAIFIESFLSFLGLGIQAPIASWGTMASEGLPALKYYPWRLFIPAIFISSTMLAFNLLGDGLRDALDPRLRK